MADEATSGQERTESPTPRRRQQARDEGRVARSVELSAALILIAGAFILSTVGGASIGRYASRLLRESTSLLAAAPMSSSDATEVLRSIASGFVLAMAPLFVGVCGIAVLVHVAQTQGVVSWNLIMPKLSHIDPIAGFRRIASGEAFFNLGKSLLKLAALGLVTYLVMARSWPELIALAQTSPADIATVLRALAVRLTLLTGLAFLVISGIDYAFQRVRLERSLRMTRQEVVQEFRETEGDPHVKARVRAIAAAIARRRMLHAVPTADVVVINPTEIAVALKYDAAASPAPVVLAMGQRKLAQRIRDIALKANVPVLENRPVARALLATCKVGRPIPAALYAAVAEILVFVYRHRASIAGRVTTLPPAASPLRRAA